MAHVLVTHVAMESVFPLTMSVMTTWTVVTPVMRLTAPQRPLRTPTTLTSCLQDAPTPQASLVCTCTCTW